jgi:hypothetical protein
LTLSYYSRVKKAFFQRWIHAQSNQRWKRLSIEVQKSGSKSGAAARPVIFFNASTRLQAMSQNAAYAYLTSQMLLLQGVPTLQFICKSGMSHCALGTSREELLKAPPCKNCVAQSRSVFSEMPTYWFEYNEDLELKNLLSKLSFEALCSFKYQEVPLGFWATNSLRWVLRCYHIENSDETRTLMQDYLLSAWNIVKQFEKLVDEVNPRSVVVFNGMFYPEAAVRFVCLKKGIRVITHEVGMRAFTAFFTNGEATAYPVKISDDFRLSDEMNEKLDRYLSDRFQGNFSMAGIRFWPQMKGLDTSFLDKAAHFKYIVPIFTNVIFDTSQVHANTIFSDMFTWLDIVKTHIQKHPETLFVIRAHPDEHRENKESRESVRDWVKKNAVDQLQNVIFVDSLEFISSYDLIERSHAVLVYNSTIGLEATLFGKPVLAAGKARYTQIPTVFLPASGEAYEKKLEELITKEEIEIPQEFIENSRRFLYYQLYLSSIPFDHFLQEDGVWPGYVTLKDFQVEDLNPERSVSARVLTEGILKDSLFEMPK